MDYFVVVMLPNMRIANYTIHANGPCPSLSEIRKSVHDMAEMYPEEEREEKEKEIVVLNMFPIRK